MNKEECIVLSSVWIMAFIIIIINIIIITIIIIIIILLFSLLKVLNKKTCNGLHKPCGFTWPLAQGKHQKVYLFKKKGQIIIQNPVLTSLLSQSLYQQPAILILYPYIPSSKNTRRAELNIPCGKYEWRIHTSKVWSGRGQFSLDLIYICPAPHNRDIYKQ